MEKKRLQTKCGVFEKKTKVESSKKLKKSRASAKTNGIAAASEFFSGPALDFIKSQIQMSDRSLKAKRWNEMKMQSVFVPYQSKVL